MKKQLAKPEEIIISANVAGEPVGLTRDGQRLRIAAIYERWHLADEWWGKEVKRHYFKIGTSRGVFDIYHDVLEGRWYLDRVYD